MRGPETREEIVLYTGISGNFYSFSEYAFDVDGKYGFDTSHGDIAGVYILARKYFGINNRLYYIPLYIDESTEVASALKTHKYWAFVRENMLDCVCVHREDNVAERRSIVRDIRSAYLKSMNAAKPDKNWFCDIQCDIGCHCNPGSDITT